MILPQMFREQYFSKFQRPTNPESARVGWDHFSASIILSLSNHNCWIALIFANSSKLFSLLLHSTEIFFLASEASNFRMESLRSNVWLYMFVRYRLLELGMEICSCIMHQRRKEIVKTVWSKLGACPSRAQE